MRKALVIIDANKEALIDRQLSIGQPITSISRMIGISHDTLREKLRRRKRGDPNWHNRAGVDNRGAYMKALAARKSGENTPEGDERDDIRIRLFDLTKAADGVTIQQAMKLSGYSESVCRRELDEFCKKPMRSDVEAICKVVDGRYYALGWQGKMTNTAYAGIKIIQVIRGRN